MKIRHERVEDRAIRRLLIAAFGGSAEAKLVDGLREDGALALALVAEDAGDVVGYVASPAQVAAAHWRWRPSLLCLGGNAKASARR